MPVWSEQARCPKCGQLSLERETWMSTKVFREECCECGYFRELSKGYSVADELGIFSDEGLHILDQDKLLEALGQMHFNTDTYPCMREGFIRKDEAGKGQYLIVGNWFSSPSALEDLEVDWIEARGSEDDIALNKAQQAQIKDFIRGYYSKLKIKAIYLFHKHPLNEEASTAPLSVVLVTPTPEAVVRDGSRTVARLEQALLTQVDRPVKVSVRRSKASEGIRLDFAVSSKEKYDESCHPEN